MTDPNPSIYSLFMVVLLTVFWGGFHLLKGRLSAPAALRLIWVLFLAMAVSEWLSFTLALWILALLSFCSL